MTHRLILASASQPRRTLLEGLGVLFEVIPSTVDEPAHPELSPRKRAQELARLKAEDVSGRNPDAWVIGCDTLVEAADGTLLEKPQDEDEARQMLRLHSGNTSFVHSALCLLSPNHQVFEEVSTSSVQFRSLQQEDIDWWISHSEFWQGRSGAFQIDGRGQLLIERIEGDWTGVVGFPVFLFGELCRKAGLKLFE